MRDDFSFSPARIMLHSPTLAKSVKAEKKLLWISVEGEMALPAEGFCIIHKTYSNASQVPGQAKQKLECSVCLVIMLFH